MIEWQHLVHSWATRTLTGSGAGIVARSPSWPDRIDSGDDLLGALIAYLPQGSTAILGEGRPAPVSVEVRATDVGVFVAVRRYAGMDGLGRPGRFTVHVAWTPQREVDVRVALELAAHPHMGTAWDIDGEPDETLPSLFTSDGADPPSRPLAEREFARRLRLEILQTLRDRRPVVLLDVAASWRLLREALAPLPAALCRGMSVSTFTRHPSDADLAIAFTETDLVPVDSRSVPQKRVVAVDAVGSGVDGDLRGVLSVLQRHTPPDTISSVEHLVGWSRRVSDAEAVLLASAYPLPTVPGPRLEPVPAEHTFLPSPRFPQDAVPLRFDGRPISVAPFMPAAPAFPSRIPVPVARATVDLPDRAASTSRRGRSRGRTRVRATTIVAAVQFAVLAASIAILVVAPHLSVLAVVAAQAVSTIVALAVAITRRRSARVRDRRQSVR